MQSDQLKRVEFKVNLLLKAFFSFYGGSPDYDPPFDSMKDAVIDELLQILDADVGEGIRGSFISMFGRIPYDNRKWWADGISAILKHKDSSIRLKGLQVLVNYPSSQLLPIEIMQPILKQFVKKGTDEEVLACLDIFSKGLCFGRDDSGKDKLILDGEDLKTLSRHQNKKIRLAAVEAATSLMDRADPRASHRASHVSEDIVLGLVSFLEDEDNEVLVALATPLVIAAKSYALYNESFLKAKNDRARFIGVLLYLRYDLVKKRFRGLEGAEPDLTVVAKLTSDSFPPIAKIAEEYIAHYSAEHGRNRRPEGAL